MVEALQILKMKSVLSYHVSASTYSACKLINFLARINKRIIFIQKSKLNASEVSEQQIDVKPGQISGIQSQAKNEQNLKKSQAYSLSFLLFSVEIEEFFSTLIFSFIYG